VHVAFRNPEGSKVLVVLNSGATARSFSVRSGGSAFFSTLPPASVATFVWR
jgi:glucosylceramidase